MWKKIAARVLIVLGFLSLIVFKDAVRDGVWEGLSISFRVLIPSLFCFSVLVNFLLRIGAFRNPGKGFDRLAGKLFHVSGAAVIPVLAGLLGGFPLGAGVLSQMLRDGSISKQEAYAVSALCNQAGPAFVIGALGSVLGSPLLGLLLFLIHLVSVFLTALLLRPETRAPVSVRRKQSEPLPAPQAFTEAVRDSAFAMVQLTGFVVFFTAWQSLICQAVPSDRLPDSLVGLLQGTLELSSGAARFTGITASRAFLPLAFLIGWGGVCVHLQAASFMLPAGIPMRRYLLGKTLQGFLCAALASFAQLFLFPDRKDPLIAALFCPALLLAGIFLFRLKKNSGKKQKICYNREKSTV